MVRFHLLVMLALTVFASSALAAKDAGKIPRELRIEKAGKVLGTIEATSFVKRTDLRPFYTRFTVPYGSGPQAFAASISMKHLLKEWKVSKNDSLKFICHDGYEFTIPASRLVPAKSHASEAFLVVETSRDKLGVIRSPSSTEARRPGPFFLTWLRAEWNKITQNDWPYLISKVEIVSGGEKK